MNECVGRAKMFTDCSRLARLGALCVWAADKETDTMLPACILPYGHKQDPHLTNSASPSP